MRRVLRGLIATSALVAAGCHTSPPCAPKGPPSIGIETGTEPALDGGAPPAAHVLVDGDYLPARLVDPNGGDPYLFIDVRLRGLRATRLSLRADLLEDGKLVAQAYQSSHRDECQPDGAILIRHFGIQLRDKKVAEVEGHTMQLRLFAEDLDHRKATATVKGMLHVAPYSD